MNLGSNNPKLNCLFCIVVPMSLEAELVLDVPGLFVKLLYIITV